ncbi:MAG TPA: hypothetical protein ENI61_04150 [Ignavibacteria bacterium]|nr:hypothetical protein [Ignavibacteria bacterium]
MIKFPDNSQRITIIGRTGSGKTHAALWHLSIRNLKNLSWIILNTKGSNFFDKIKRIKKINFDSHIKENGIYIIEPYPEQKEELNKFLLNVWRQGNCGLFIDEAADIGTLPAYERILRQGRERIIPVIQCTQRPVDVSHSAFTEAEFFQIFYIKDERDQKTISFFAPLEKQDWQKMARGRQSYYYNVLDDQVNLIQPLPDKKTILNRINMQLQENYFNIL